MSNFKNLFSALDDEEGENTTKTVEKKVAAKKPTTAPAVEGEKP